MFKKMFMLVCLLGVALIGTGCERIQTGEVGLRVNMSKEIESKELLPGSWNQSVVGSILTFPTRDITVSVENKKPLTSDTSALDDFDVTVVYTINPTSVSELYSTKSKSFHGLYDGDIYLMYNYINTLVNNASYKAVREFKSLEVADKRDIIEEKIKSMVNDQLKTEKLDNAITINVVQVRSVIPNADILKSATDYVRSQNELKIKQNEVKIAEEESKRMAALALNSEKSIAYMNAQATLNISEGVKNGKVQTIIVPSNMTGLMLNK